MADYPLPLPGDERGVRRVDFSKDGRWAAVISDFSIINLWDMDKVAEARQLGPFATRLENVRFSPDGGWLSWDESLTESMNLLKMSDAIGGKPIVVPGTVIAFSDDGRWLVTGGTNQSAYLWDLQDSNFCQHGVEIDSGQQGVYLAQFGPGNRDLLTVGYDKVARFWALNEEKKSLDPKGQFTLPDRPVQVFLAVSQDWLAIKFDPSLVDFDHQTSSTPQVKSNTSILLFRLDFTNGKGIEFTLADSETLPVQNGLISPDGKWLLTGMWDHFVYSKTGEDSLARLYDLKTEPPGKNSVVLRGHLAKLSAAVFSANSRYLATGSEDGGVKLWPLANVLNAGVSPTLDGSPDGTVMSLEFDTQSNTLLAPSKDGTARVWQISSRPGTPVILSSSSKEVDQASMSPRGDWIVTSGDDLSAWLWPVHLDKLADLGCKAADRTVPLSELERYLSKSEAESLCANRK